MPLGSNNHAFRMEQLLAGAVRRSELVCEALIPGLSWVPGFLMACHFLQASVQLLTGSNTDLALKVLSSFSKATLTNKKVCPLKKLKKKEDYISAGQMHFDRVKVLLGERWELRSIRHSSNHLVWVTSFL